jgi:hypothetical protein
MPDYGIPDILARMHGTRLASDDEALLQNAMAEAFVGLPFEREHSFSRHDRVDFFFKEAGIAVEVKVAGSPNEVLRQLHRYAQHEDVKALLLVTTRAAHRLLPGELNGKRLQVVHMSPMFGVVP